MKIGEELVFRSPGGPRGQVCMYTIAPEELAINPCGHRFHYECAKDVARSTRMCAVDGPRDLGF